MKVRDAQRSGRARNLNSHQPIPVHPTFPLVRKHASMGLNIGAASVQPVSYGQFVSKVRGHLREPGCSRDVVSRERPRRRRGALMVVGSAAVASADVVRGPLGIQLLTAQLFGQINAPRTTAAASGRKSRCIHTDAPNLPRLGFVRHHVRRRLASRKAAHNYSGSYPPPLAGTRTPPVSSWGCRC